MEDKDFGIDLEEEMSLDELADTGTKKTEDTKTLMSAASGISLFTIVADVVLVVSGLLVHKAFVFLIIACVLSWVAVTIILLLYINARFYGGWVLGSMDALGAVARSAKEFKAKREVAKEE